MVEVFAFHLMPYQKMPEDFNEKYDSAWVTYSNRNFDPEFVSRLYNLYLDELAFCEEMGFDGVGVNEHHQTVYGLMPSPNVMAAALAQRTEKIKIAILGNAISLRDHPVRVAEEIAMLDVMTKGRIISGFVRGIGAEYYSFRLDPTKSKERFYEAHDIIKLAWTEDGPTSYYGKHYTVPTINPWPRPYQQPHPPIWCPSQGSKDTIRFAAKNRYPYLQTFSSLESVKASLDYYRECAENNGYKASPSQLGWSVFVYCAETDARAYEEAEEHAMFFFNKLFVIPQDLLFPPGYVPEESLHIIRKSKAGLGKPGAFTFKELVDKRYIIVGSPQSVRDQLIELQKYLGFGVLNINIHFGNMPHHRTMKNIELIGKEVIPALHDLG
jgi:alkanesulfonate monooxygenase SsuD/methylene tetrahydromethanopterin reductase-like flavin-dependent oxidoreductase (luciferase family)